MQDFFHQQYVYSFWGPYDAPLWVEEALCQAWCWLILFQYLAVKQEKKINSRNGTWYLLKSCDECPIFWRVPLTKTHFGGCKSMMFKGGKAHYRHTLHMSENPQKSIQNCRVFAGETSHFAVNRFRLVGGGNEPPGEAKVRAKRQRCEKKKPFGVSTLYKL